MVKLDNTPEEIPDEFTVDGSAVPQQSIADMIRDAANEVLHSRVPEGFQWIEAYGQYFSPSCGFFYDPNTNLFYHSDSETFYIFNDDNQQYEVYKRMRKTHWNSRANKKKARQMFCGVLDHFDQDAVDVCEIVFDMTAKLSLESSENECDDHKDWALFSPQRLFCFIKKPLVMDYEYDGDGFPVEYFDDTTGEITCVTKKPMRTKCTNETKKSREVRKLRRGNVLEAMRNGTYNLSMCEEECSDESSEEEDERIQMKEEEGFLQPPLLRIIDSKNNLHVITMSGGSVGRQSGSDIIIEDPSISRKLLEFVFVPESNSFVVVKLTDNGHVALNDYELTAKDGWEIAHGDVLRFGLELLCLNLGNNTCTGCEPGLLKADMSTVSPSLIVPSGETARRRNLKAIKAMYGINEYVENARRPFYGNDRAAKRRRLVGSEMDIKDKDVDPGDIYSGSLAKPLPGAVVVSKVGVEQPLNEANKGFRLLQNMGWKEGKGLGKGEQGRQEPVRIDFLLLII
uniref:G-patch domain-containing protein n=1 Tax=Angiostrongylus cantonensis TaxID=6313 RepID=A0A0K0DL64_ANGCA